MPRIAAIAPISFLVAGLLTLAASGPALAWGADGHRMIGELAMRSLPSSLPAFLRTPAARAPRATVVPPQESVQPEEDTLTSKLQALSRLRAPDGPLTLGNGGGGAGLAIS